MRQTIKDLAPYLICMLIVIVFIATTKDAINVERQINDIRYAEQSEAVQALTDALQEQGEQLAEFSRTISELQQAVEDNEFKANPDVPLLPELQSHAQAVCKTYDLPLDTVYSIIWHESRYQVDVPDNINRNGSIDRGLMQINSCNWKWLSELGLDVSKPQDNITAGCYILALHTQKYGLQDGLRAYAVGAKGMKNGSGYWFLEELGI